MDDNILRYLFISAVVMITSFIVNYLRKKIYQPKYEDKVQKPGKLERFIVKLLMFIDVFLIIFVVIGILMKEMEMAVVFGCLALFILVAIIILKRAHDTSYQENAEYFILKIRNKEYQVFYENIIDWQPSYNEIAILDKTHSDGKYIRVNIKIFKPEILLRKVANMAFEGKFHTLDQADPDRKVETVYYLVNHNYRYLVEDYLQTIDNKST